MIHLLAEAFEDHLSVLRMEAGQHPVADLESGLLHPLGALGSSGEDSDSDTLAFEDARESFDSPIVENSVFTRCLG